MILSCVCWYIGLGTCRVRAHPLPSDADCSADNFRIGLVVAAPLRNCRRWLTATDCYPEMSLFTVRWSSPSASSIMLDNIVQSAGFVRIHHSGAVVYCLFMHVFCYFYDILTTRLSPWFGIHRSVLSWFKYLPSRCFRGNNLSSCISPPATFPEALFSVLYCSSCKLFSVLLSPPFPWIIVFIQMSLTQLLFSFHPPNFDSSITPSKFSSSDLFLDDCKSFNSQLSTPQKLASCSSDSKINLPKYITPLLTQHHPLCSQPRCRLRWTPHLCRPYQDIPVSNLSPSSVYYRVFT